ncbi:MAG: complex I subunit 5 family protein [Pseudomonadota bacterium]|uniref:complex I subunit 5 family protein n=1 Tax=Thermithiobacillus tepidarius TaxID=929 RepID=UPI0003F5C8D5|nr:proton-conducting transporter membrane subunit [Thermithiobacillus tepidarius]
MNWDAWLPLLIVLSSLVPGLAIFILREESHALRTALNMSGAVLKLFLMAVMTWGVFHGHAYETRWTLVPGWDLVLRADTLSVLFANLSALLWFLTTLYAIGYLEGSPHRSRFFGFFSLCVSATVGIALSGNLITFLLFYEALTLATYPLVVHRGTEAALRAGRIYLAYTLGGGALLLVGVVWLQVLAGPLDFTAGGVLAGLGDARRATLIVIFALLIAGLGVKAALVPLHGWLPMAMVAPAPVSALLHAVAVVKAGAFGIVRVVYDVYGVQFAEQLGVLGPLAALAAATIVYGSLRALGQDDLKRRLAYSTVSQVSYITLGTAIFGPVATIGGVVHLVHQGLMKITLFFCAGNLAETLGIHRVSEMNGVAWRMPWTMGAFTLGALGMIGVPPLAGFISKWYLGVGGLVADQPWVVGVLAVSTLLNAAYFLPILYAAWFREAAQPWPAANAGQWETRWMLLLPPLVTAFLVLGAGLLANLPLSPLAWSRLIADREYVSWTP